MHSKYVHYVASFSFDGKPEIRASGIVKVPDFQTPDQTHSHIQIAACKKLSLDVDDFQFDIVVEKMTQVE